MNEENKIILYQDDNEITRVSVRFADEDLCLTQSQLAEIYDTSQQNISQHIDNIYKDGELIAEATNKKFLLVRQEGNRQVRRNIDHYNLDMVIALGYRVQSQIATRFRRWATQRLHEYIQKRKILIGKGNISHKQAIEKAEKEFEIYRKREMDMLESDFDKEIKKLNKK